MLFSRPAAWHAMLAFVHCRMDRSEVKVTACLSHIPWAGLSP